LILMPDGDSATPRMDIWVKTS